MYSNRNVKCPECGGHCGYLTPSLDNKGYKPVACRQRSGCRSEHQVERMEEVIDDKGQVCISYSMRGTLRSLYYTKLKPGIIKETFLDIDKESSKNNN